MNLLLKFRLPFAVVTLTTLAGCSSDTTSPTKSGQPDVEAVSQISIDGVVGKIASSPPTIRVTDSKTHKPLADIPVEFSALDGAGSVTNNLTATDSMGLASAGKWTFSTRTSKNYLSVYVNGKLSLLFTATLKPDIPAHFVPITPIDQAGLPGTEITGPGVYVQDQYTNPVPGIAVSFALLDQRTRSLERTTGISDNAGLATSGGWALGSTPGTTHTTASVPGIESLVFNAHILDPASIKWYTLDSLRIGTNEVTATSSGISGARFGITGFDPCLCKKQDGYFVEEVVYSAVGGAIDNTSGNYSLDGPTLTISSLTDPGTIQNGKVYLVRRDPDFGFVFTWVYKELSQ